jgi:metal-responsive CopG/Arc/MetJ family transcriptional regulator
MAKKPEKKAEPSGSVGVSVRLPKELVTQIDSLAVEQRRSRGNMLRLLVEEALTHRKQEAS